MPPEHFAMSAALHGQQQLVKHATRRRNMRDEYEGLWITFNTTRAWAASGSIWDFATPDIGIAFAWQGIDRGGRQIADSVILSTVTARSLDATCLCNTRD